MVRDEVAYSDEKATPCQPSHAEDAAVEEKDRTFDHRDAPGVDVHVCESYLQARSVSATKCRYPEKEHTHD